MELWTSRVNRFLKEKLYAANFFLDYSDAVTDADTVHIPHISDTFRAAAIPVTSGALDATDISETKTDLVVDQWYGSAYFITKFEEREIMKRPNIASEYQKAMGYDLGRTLERDLLGELDGINNFPAKAGLTTTDLVATNIEYAMGILASNSVPKEECRIFLTPKVKILPFLIVILRDKLRKLRETLFEAIRSQALFWEGSTTIIGASI